MAAVPGLPPGAEHTGHDQQRIQPIPKPFDCPLRKYIHIVPPSSAYSKHTGSSLSSSHPTQALGHTNSNLFPDIAVFSPESSSKGTQMNDLIPDLAKPELPVDSHNASGRGGGIAVFENIAHRTLRNVHIRLAMGQHAHGLFVETHINSLSCDTERQGDLEGRSPHTPTPSVAVRRSFSQNADQILAEVGASCGQETAPSSAWDSETDKGGGAFDQQCNNESQLSPVGAQVELVFAVNNSHGHPPLEICLSPELGRASVIFGLNDGKHETKADNCAAGSMPSPGGGRMRFCQSPRMNAPHAAAGFLLDAKMSDRCFLSPNRDLSHVECGSHSSPNSLQVFSTDCVKAASNRDPRPSMSCDRSPGGDGNTIAAASINPPAASVGLEPRSTYDPSMTEERMSDLGPSQDQDQANNSQEVGQDNAQVEDAENKHNPMSYQIPPAMLRTAMAASPNSAGSYYSQALYRGPEDRLLSIHYCTTMEIAERVAPYFLKEKIVGFDIEWKPYGSSIKENASLIQIACADRIALFHIALYDGTTAEELLPPTLRTIIESPDICKAGVAIKGDFKRLRDHLGVEAKGVFELSRLHNLVVHFDTNRKKSSSWRLYALAKQVHEHLQLPMYKGPVRESDWSKRLTYSQIQYAATDAYASLRIYDALEAKRKKLRPIPPRPELCDFDSTTRPRSTARPKVPSKAAELSEPTPTEGPIQFVEQPDTEEESVYETAEEDLVDSQELERLSDSESSSESADLTTAPDADFVPSSRKFELGQSQRGRLNDTTSIPRQIQRVGRVKLESLLGPDPAYPTLPIVPTDEGGSDSESAFVPPPTLLTPSKTRVTQTGDTLRLAVVDNYTEMADYDEARAHGNEQGMGGLEYSRDELPCSPDYHALSEGKGQERNVKPKPRNSTIKKKQAKPTDPSESIGESASAVEVVAPTSQPPQLATTPFKSPEYLLADSWAQSYLFDSIPPPSATAAPSRIRASIPHLRAYHLWHHQNLSLDAIARHLRNPPLAESTVCSYILQAISFEKLEYGREDVKVVLRALPLSVRMGRWWWFVEKVGGV